MSIEETRPTGAIPRREIGTLRLPDPAAEGATPWASGDSTTIDGDTRALLAAMRRIATVEAEGAGAPEARVAALKRAVREGALDIDTLALARAIFRDEGI